MADRRDLEDAESAGLQIGADELGEIFGLRHVDLVQRDELRAIQERQLPLGHRVGGEFGEDHVEVAERVATRLERRAVQDVHQGRAALDVAEELEPEALAFAGAFDEPGDVGDCVAHLTGLDDAEVRVQRRERIVGDLGPCRRDRGDQTRLARRRIAHERDVGHGLELEEDIAFPAGCAQQCEAGGLALRVRERGIAETADAAGSDDESHSRLDHVDERLARHVLHDGADGNLQLERFAGRTGAVVAHPEAAVARGTMRRVVVGEQCRHLRVRDEHDVAAVPAVAAVGAGQRLELLALHRDTAVAALAGGQVQRHSVDECDHALPLTVCGACDRS